MDDGGRLPEVLWRAHGVARSAVDVDTADDLAQEFTVQWWQREREGRRRYDAKRPLGPFIRGAMRFKIANLRRRVRRQAGVHLLYEEARAAATRSWADPAGPFEYAELVLIVRRALVRMPRRRRATFIRVRLGGQSHAVVAARLGITVKTVENLVGLATKVLRTVVGRYLAAGPARSRRSWRGASGAGLYAAFGDGVRPYT
jgi:RNA polymerase sigma-70 factor (ECF subfamily)